MKLVLLDGLRSLANRCSPSRIGTATSRSIMIEARDIGRFQKANRGRDPSNRDTMSFRPYDAPIFLDASSATTDEGQVAKLHERAVVHRMTINDTQLANALSSEILQLIILPTEACNFRCVYCYERFERGRMTPVVVGALKTFITSRVRGLSTLSISWFGGEPLLALNIIEDVSRHVKSLVSKYTGVSYYADMTTNGYLLDTQVFQLLMELGISRYQITLDGPRELHNRKRVLAGGEGTFDRIWSNLEAIGRQDGQFTIDVRLHLDRENYPYILDFVKEYEALFKKDKRFRLFFRPLSCLGGKNDKNLPVFDDIDGKVKVNELKKYMHEHAISYKVVDGSQGPRPICYAAKFNSFIIRANGYINKCTVAFSNDLNQVGTLNENGTLTVDVEKLRRWGRGLESGRNDELTCPLQNLT